METATQKPHHFMRTACPLSAFLWSMHLLIRAHKMGSIAHPFSHLSNANRTHSITHSMHFMYSSERHTIVHHWSLLIIFKLIICRINYHGSHVIEWFSGWWQQFMWFAYVHSHTHLRRDFVTPCEYTHMPTGEKNTVLARERAFFAFFFL